MSKMKQHLEERIVISGSRQDNTGWKRYICFEYQGNDKAKDGIISERDKKIKDLEDKIRGTIAAFFVTTIGFVLVIL